MRRRAWNSIACGLVIVWGCTGKEPPESGASGSTDTSGSTGTSSRTETSDADASETSSTVGTGTGSGGSGPATDSSSGAGGSGSDTAGAGVPIDCGGTIYACGDGIDNDGDGRIDFLDRECTGPCDDDEGSFQTGIPGDNMDCRQDCFFDGNSGQGDDGCVWELRCDPENPGENIGCAYTGGNNCDNVEQTEACIEFCTPFVPPGCDCFGCCEVVTDDGSVYVFLNSSPDCSFATLEACSTCTPSVDCGVDCDPTDCVLCFGEDELPPECDEHECNGDQQTCQDHEDCAFGYYCLLGCCVPPPPG